MNAINDKEIRINSKGRFKKFQEDLKSAGFLGKISVISNSYDELGAYFKRFIFLYVVFPILGPLFIILSFFMLEEPGLFLFFLICGIGIIIAYIYLRKKLQSELRRDENAYYLFDANGITIEKPYDIHPYVEIKWENVGYICWLEDLCVFMDNNKNLLFMIDSKEYAYTKENIDEALALTKIDVKEMPYEECIKLPWARKNRRWGIICVILVIVIWLIEFFLEG